MRGDTGSILFPYSSLDWTGVCPRSKTLGALIHESGSRILRSPLRVFSRVGGSHANLFVSLKEDGSSHPRTHSFNDSEGSSPLFMEKAS